MAFETVNVNSLRGAIESCKSTIDYRNSQNIIANGFTPNVWQCAAAENLKSAMIRLVEERYRGLETRLETYEQIVIQINEYKRIEAENQKLQEQAMQPGGEQNLQLIKTNEERMNQIVRKVESMI